MTHFKNPSDIKAAVVGYGAAFNIGRVHLAGMQAAGMQPTAVVEPDPKRRAAAEQEFPGIATYGDLGAMFRGSDANLAAILTPHNTHATIALECLRAGRHVVCEKPFAVTTAECDSMIREARKRELVLSTYHNRHWDGCIMEAVKHVRDKRAIGDIYRIEAHMGGRHAARDWWRDSKSISGGRLYDWGVHMLEYALQLIDAEIVEVTGLAKTGYWAPKCKWKEDTAEDEGFAVVRFSNGAWLTLSVTALDLNPKRGVLEITGTDGTYIMNHQDYEIIRPRGKQTVVTKGRNMDGQWDAYYANVTAHMVKGEPLVITPEWARRPIHILDLADQSARKGKAMKAKCV